MKFLKNNGDKSAICSSVCEVKFGSNFYLRLEQGYKEDLHVTHLLLNGSSCI